MIGVDEGIGSAMAPMGVTTRIGDQQALEAFVVENAELEKIEGLLEQFNIFEAVGVVRQELRHSDFLAFLLDPRQNHRLGDVFARRLLQKVLISGKDLAPRISPVDLDSWNLDQLTVRREWQNIDILLVDERNRFVVLIENKIDAIEHSNQLSRYLTLVRDTYPEPEWRLLAIYLTPDGEDPSEADYLPADYGLVAEASEAVAESRRSVLDPAASALMIHYARMLRRHVVSDSEIADLCRRIYTRHQRALDLIFEHRPDRLSEIQRILVDLVESRDDLILDTSSKQYLRFGVAGWEGLPKGAGWTRSGRMVLFELASYPDRLDLSLYVGPGPAEARRMLIDLATARQPPFRVPRRSEGKNQKFRMIFTRRLLTADEHHEATIGEIEARIRAKWEEFLDRDLPALVPPIQEASNSIGAASEDGGPTTEMAVGEANETGGDRRYWP